MSVTDISSSTDVEKNDQTEPSSLQLRLEKISHSDFINAIYARRRLSKPSSTSQKLFVTSSSTSLKQKPSEQQRLSALSNNDASEMEEEVSKVSLVPMQVQNLSRVADPDIYSLEDKMKYVVLTLRTLVSNFCPNFKVTLYFKRITETLGIDHASISLLPGCALVSVEDREDGTVERIRSWNVHTTGGLNMEKLEAAEILIQNFTDGWYSSLEDAIAEMRKLSTLPSSYPRPLKVLAFGGICLGATPMFNGSPLDTLISFMLGLGFGWVLVYGLNWVPSFVTTFDFWSSALFALIARIIMQLLHAFGTAQDGLHPLPVNFIAVILPPLIWVLPGFAMINGFVDFLYGMRVMGIVNIFNALFVAFSVGFGLLVGYFSLFWLPAPVIEYEIIPSRLAFEMDVFGPSKMLFGWLLPSWFHADLSLLLIFVITIFFVSITFDVHHKQIPGIMTVATLAYFTVDKSAGASFFGIGKSMLSSSRGFVTRLLASGASSVDELVADHLVTKAMNFGLPEAIRYLFGGFVAGSLASLYSHISSFSSTPLIYLGIVILAPGTYGARAFLHFARCNYIEGLHRFFNMMFVSLAIAMGTVIGRVVTMNKK